MSAVFGIPAHGKLQENSIRCLVQICAGMLARAHHEMNFVFHDVGSLAFKSDLIPELIIFTGLAVCLVIAV
jgi:hypothetical protein